MTDLTNMHLRPRPPIARQHCRHYSYQPTGDGPTCGVGVDLSAGAYSKCMPEALEKGHICDLREEWTEAERKASKCFTDHRMAMIALSIAAIPGPISLGTASQGPCPHCGDTMNWHRGRNGNVWIDCRTPNCLGSIHLVVDRKAEWPKKETSDD